MSVRIVRAGALALITSALGCSSTTMPQPPGAAGATSGTGPGADTPGGYGTDSPAGDEGTVIRVTTLAASGPGSLAEAIATPGPRAIVFEVGGVIDLALARLEVREPFVTIAGQTAPPPGITLIRGGLRVFTHDVRIEHLRLRMGDAGAAPASGFEPDVTTDGPDAYNVVFNHLSVSWGVDENLSVSGPRLNGPSGTSRSVTIQNSIIAEGLRNSVHEKGAHSMGTLIHDYCTNVAVVRNLFAHNDERNPWYKGFATGVIVNNVIYDPGRWAIRLGPVDSEWSSAGIVPEGPRVSVVGNLLRHGASTTPGLALVATNSRGSAFLEGNAALDASGGEVAIFGSSIAVLGERPAWPEGLVAESAESAAEWVLAHAGARPRERDAVDQRIVRQVLEGTGAIIDSQDQVGGYPEPTPSERPLDVPATGVAAWLRELAAALE